MLLNEIWLLASEAQQYIVFPVTNGSERVRDGSSVIFEVMEMGLDNEN